MGNFEITDNFYLDGKPFQIISGAIHYFRIVPEYWQDRLEKSFQCQITYQTACQKIYKNHLRNISLT